MQKFDQLTTIFEAESVIKLAYLFGSQATGNTGPLSDHDFAFYIEEKDRQKRAELKLKLINDLCKALSTNNVDVVFLDDPIGYELKYNIIKNGELLYSVEPFKVLVEPRIMNEYFDFKQSLSKYNLTQG